MPAEESVSEQVVVVVAGGEELPREALRAVPKDATVIAADGGLVNARALELDVAEAVGDFDSVPDHVVSAAESAGVRLRRHPEAKDATDLELALDAALAREPSRVVVLAGLGDRLDHLLAALLLLASEKWADVELDAFVGVAQVHVVRGGRQITGEPGELVSLVPLHGAARGVSTEGLEYELRGETLEPGSSRGVSNVFARDVARIAVDRGVLLAVRPRTDGGGG